MNNRHRNGMRGTSDGETGLAYRLTKWTRIAMATGVAMAVTAVARPAMAADDGYENVFTSVLTAVGVVSADKSPEIDYRERAPLVVPPKASLVQPEQPGKARSAAWPADPDVIKRKKAADDARAPSWNGNKNERMMSKDEQLKYRAAQQDDGFDPYACKISDHSMSHCRIDPDEMKRESEAWNKMNPAKGDKVEAGVEPEREWLTQPPKGYLKTTKTMTATHEAPVPKRDDSGPLSTYIHPVENKVDPLSN